MKLPISCYIPGFFSVGLVKVDKTLINLYPKYLKKKKGEKGDLESI